MAWMTVFCKTTRDSHKPLSVPRCLTARPMTHHPSPMTKILHPGYGRAACTSYRPVQDVKMETTPITEATNPTRDGNEARFYP